MPNFSCWHIVVDALGLLVSVAVTAASADDGRAAPRVLAEVDGMRVPRLEVVYGDGQYRNHDFDWLTANRMPYRVEAVSRPEGA